MEDRHVVLEDVNGMMELVCPYATCVYEGETDTEIDRGRKRETRERETHTHTHRHLAAPPSHLISPLASPPAARQV